MQNVDEVNKANLSTHTLKNSTIINMKRWKEATKKQKAHSHIRIY